MKKITLTILLGMAIGPSAQHVGGLFQRGNMSEDIYFHNGGYAYDRANGGLLPALPNHGGTNNQDAPSDVGGRSWGGLCVLKEAQMTGKIHDSIEMSFPRHLYYINLIRCKSRLWFSGV